MVQSPSAKKCPFVFRSVKVFMGRGVIGILKKKILRISRGRKFAEHCFTGTRYVLAPHLNDVDEYVLVAELESSENFVEVLSVHFPDYSLEKLFHCRVVTRTVFSHVDNAMQARHLFENTSVSIFNEQQAQCNCGL